jgi:hypothetical protein
MFVQIYAAFVLVTWLGMAYWLHGKEVPEYLHVIDFRHTFLSVLSFLPMFGRVFGWW